MPVTDGHEPGGRVVGVAVATANDVRSAVVAALAMLGEPIAMTADAVALLPAPPTPHVLREAACTVAGAQLAIARPRTGLGGLVNSSGDWREVDLPAGARRFDRVRVPARLLDRPLVLALQFPSDAGSPTPISLLARFAHPRLWLAARVGGDPGAIAELAAPLRPRLTVLAGRHAGRAVVVLTRDLIAAELIAQALISAGPDSPADAPGPWEQPSVQRATDLDLGVRTPAGLRLIAGDNRADAFLAELRPRIGVE